MIAAIVTTGNALLTTVHAPDYVMCE